MSDAATLQLLYEVYADWSGRFACACQQACASCCTQSVTMTTLEGEIIIAFLEKNDRLNELLPLPQARFSPAMTTNQFAGCCLAQQEPPAAVASPWNYEPCFFLKDRLCSIYPARPFSCRSFYSMSRCDRNGAAEIPPLMITVNTVFMQIIEDLDSGRGCWGNMGDILRFMLAGKPTAAGYNLLPALQFPGFLVPPAEAVPVNKIMARLRRTARPDSSLDKLLQKHMS